MFWCQSGSKPLPETVSYMWHWPRAGWSCPDLGPCIPTCWVMHPADDSHWWNAIRLCPWTRYNRCYIHHSAASGEILVQERSQWQEPDSVLCFCWPGESVWPCPPKGLVVGYEKGGGRRVDSASSTSYVQQCTQPSESWLWVQWGIRSLCWGPSGLCSQPSTFYHCAWGFI